MDTPVITFFLVIVMFIFSFLMVDVDSNVQMKTDAYESVRAANQNALLDLQDKYDEYDELNTPAMVEEWLANFLSKNNIAWKEITINFVQIETDPPAYLMSVEGHKQSGYAIIKGGAANDNAIVKFSSGATIISDDEANED